MHLHLYVEFLKLLQLLHSFEKLFILYFFYVSVHKQNIINVFIYLKASLFFLKYFFHIFRAICQRRIKAIRFRLKQITQS